MIFYRMGCRCFWDSDTDNYAQDIFMNVSTKIIKKLPNTKCTNIYFEPLSIVSCLNSREIMLIAQAISTCKRNHPAFYLIKFFK